MNHVDQIVGTMPVGPQRGSPIDLSFDNPEAKKLDAYPGLDWLRIILASAVVLAHDNVSPWSRTGNFAVLVFFALSGWLIGGILTRTSQSELPRFYYNRATRIWIPYAVAVGAVYGLAALRDGINVDWFRFLFYDLTFTHNWFTLFPNDLNAIARMPLKGTGNHFWSISLEEQFYLLAPLFFVFTRLGQRAGFWILVSLAMAAVASPAAPVGLGVAAAIKQAEQPGWHLQWSVRIALLLVALAVAAVLVIADGLYPYVSPVLAIAIVLLCAFRGRRRALETFVGGISYPLYLLQWVGGFAVTFLAKHLGIALASVFYLLIDSNIQRYRQRFYTHARGGIAATMAYVLSATGMIVGCGYVIYLLGPAGLASLMFGPASRAATAAFAVFG